jgi:hypothetical protein
LIPESRLFFIYISLSAALGWPIIGPGLGALVAAAAGAFGFAACFLAKAGEIERATVARPITMIFFMLHSLKKTHGSQSQTLDRGQEPQAKEPERLAENAVRRADQRSVIRDFRNTGIGGLR